MKNQSLTEDAHSLVQESPIYTNEQKVTHAVTWLHQAALRPENRISKPAGGGGERGGGGQATGRGRNYCQTFEQRTCQRENIKTESTETRMWQFSELQVAGVI